MLPYHKVFIFGCVGKWAGVYSVYFYGVVWGLNGKYLYCGCSIRVFVHNTVFSLSILLYFTGLLQSAGWPTTVAIMGNCLFFTVYNI